MEHVYQNIPGSWFDYQDLYSEMVLQAPATAHFVEVGTFLGKSISFLAVEAYNSGKNITIDTVDFFCQDIRGNKEFENLASPSDGTFNVEYLANYYLEQNNLNKLVTLYSNDSIQHSRTYPINSLDFVFLDGDHTYEYLRKEIINWFPKVKQGGYLGGHDFGPEFPGVEKAVREVFADNITFWGKTKSSWLYKKTM